MILNLQIAGRLAYLFRDAAILKTVGSVSISSSFFGRGMHQLGRISSRAPGKFGLLSAPTPSSKDANVITAGDRASASGVLTMTSEMCSWSCTLVARLRYQRIFSEFSLLGSSPS